MRVCVDYKYGTKRFKIFVSSDMGVTYFWPCVMCPILFSLANYPQFLIHGVS